MSYLRTICPPKFQIVKYIYLYIYIYEKFLLKSDDEKGKYWGPFLTKYALISYQIRYGPILWIYKHIIASIIEHEKVTHVDECAPCLSSLRTHNIMSLRSFGSSCTATDYVYLDLYIILCWPEKSWYHFTYRQAERQLCLEMEALSHRNIVCRTSHIRIEDGQDDPFWTV